MPQSDLLQIARDWSYWDCEPPPSIPRRVDLPGELRPDLALVVQGVRRCGKSTLLGQLVERYALDRQRCLFMNFEDPRVAGSLDFELLQRLVDEFEASLCDRAARNAPVAYFFDEIQHVDGWQRWLRSQIDRPSHRRFVVTGSNGRLLSGELGSSLTGRHLAVELFPFDLDEVRIKEPTMGVREYLHAGGFPAPLGSEDGDRTRRTYFNDIVERDVRERVSARSSAPLRRLGQMLFESAGSKLSMRRIAAALGIAPDTASLYVGALEDAYLVFSCPFFAWSERKRSIRNKKYYPVDTGLRRCVVTRTGKDLGKMLECATYLKLRRTTRDIYYWRGRGEVDFVVLVDGTPTPIQVSWEGPSERHMAALDEFYEAHPQANEAVTVTGESFELLFE